MPDHIKHHYIPQCYLNYFGNIKTNSSLRNKEYYLHALNTKSLKTYSIAVKNACQIKNFYRLSEKTTSQNHKLNELTIECDIFANNIESGYSILLQKLYQKKEQAIVSNGNCIILSNSEREDLAYYIAVQYLRMPRYREWIMNITKGAYPQMMEVFKHLVAKVEKNPDIAKLDIAYKYDEALIHGKTGFLNQSFVKPIFNKLWDSNWIFAYSPTKDISTSNNPIVSFSMDDGYLAPIFWKSVLVYFPIFPDVLLIVMPKSKTDTQDGIFAEIQDFAFTSYHNLLASQSSDIYNYNNKFDNIIAFVNGKAENAKP